MVRNHYTRNTRRYKAPLSHRFVQNFPTLAVWTVSLFSKGIRHYAANEGKWQAGWIQFMTVGFPLVMNLVSSLL